MPTNDATDGHRELTDRIARAINRISDRRDLTSNTPARAAYAFALEAINDALDPDRQRLAIVATVDGPLSREDADHVQREVEQLRQRLIEKIGPGDWYVQRVGRCDICAKEKVRTVVAGDQRMCEDCFYQLRDVAKP